MLVQVGEPLALDANQSIALRAAEHVHTVLRLARPAERLRVGNAVDFAQQSVREILELLPVERRLEELIHCRQLNPQNRRLGQRAGGTRHISPSGATVCR